MADRAWLEIRVLPWRPRRRTMRASTLRDRVSDLDFLNGIDDLTGVVIVLGVWIPILIAAVLPFGAVQRQAGASVGIPLKWAASASRSS
jgi:hypothetical protein